MDANFHLAPSAIAFTDAAGKVEVLSFIAGLFADSYDLDAPSIEAALLQREQLGSTGFGRRVALPHARFDGLKRPLAAFVKLDHPVEYEAADGRPVDMAFGLLSPSDCGVTHLHALAAISRTMRDTDRLRQLRSAQNPDAVYALLTNVSDRDAA